MPDLSALSRQDDPVFSKVTDFLYHAFKVLSQAYKLDIFLRFSFLNVNYFIFTSLSDLLLAIKFFILLSIGMWSMLYLAPKSFKSASKLILVTITLINSWLELLSSSSLQVISLKRF